MNNFCGLDFGTSNSSLGFFNDSHVTLTEFGNKSLISSSIFFDFDDGPFFGNDAIKRYIDGKDGRMIWSPKNALGTNLVFEKTQIGRAFFSFTDIIGLIVKNIKDRAELQAEREFSSIVVGRPVFYNDKMPELDKAAVEAMRSILQHCGFKHIEFAYEPIAAAHHYQQSIDHETIVLVVDMGGGTSDFTIAKLDGETGASILAIGGVHIAGTNFDRHLSLQTVMKELGLGSRYKTLEGDYAMIPPTIHKDLATWHKIGFCYNKNNSNYIKHKIYSGEEPEKFERLLQVIEQRLGHHVAIAVEQAKIGLTAHEKMNVVMPELMPALDMTITRSQFDNAIKDDVEKIHSSMNKTIADAAIDPANIDGIFMTGGASLTPLVRDTIKRALPHARFIEGDKFGSVASGLALMARKKFG